jgi:predicted AlkP superfamily pyrophosphatase or phosphodiesterase
MKRTAVINVVGLTESLIGPGTPHLAKFKAGAGQSSIFPAFPAVTCTAQSNYLTGTKPSRHGIVANGWYDRSLAEVQFWKQSNHLVGAPKIWDLLRQSDSKFTCAQLFWWYNMYSTADYSITPRPIYPADGRKIFDIYTWPYEIRTDIKRDLGEFPFPTFWGPAAGLDTAAGAADAATRWIAASAKWIETKYAPTLSLIYLPHLDYNLQRLGPAAVQSGQTDDLARIDAIVGDLVSFFNGRGVQIIMLSEYAITAVKKPVHLNRMFRQKGWMTVKEELGLEILDCGASQVFAVADHQVAHIYLKDPTLEPRVRAALDREEGIEAVFAAPEKENLGLNHARAGDLVAVANEDAWFTYYYWQDDRLAPDFARCVDIHRKPGYDPVELFLDPKLPLVKAQILWRLLRKKLGFRMLMDVIPLNAELVRGSHGRRGTDRAAWPVMLCESPVTALPPEMGSTEVGGWIQRQVLG